MNHNGEFTLPKAKSISSFVAMDLKIENFVVKSESNVCFISNFKHTCNKNKTNHKYFLPLKIPKISENFF